MRRIDAITLVMLLAIAPVVWLTLSAVSLCSCSPASSRAIHQPNPMGADCIADRGIVQRECVRDKKTDAEISACIENVRRTIDCTTEAGVSAWVTSRDGGYE